jgi:hypothetical protein
MMNEDFRILKKIYNAFDPFLPLPAGDPVYVDCREVRGDGDILIDLGREILFSERTTCQLYGGHRGAGKSTELLRLKAHLEEKDCFVVYFGADEEDIDPEDAQYTDILLACTRHLIEELKEADKKPLLDWLRDRWEGLKAIALTEVSFDSANLEVQLALFAKITANLRAVPDQRHKIRELVNPHTVTLISSLNEFIGGAKKNLPEEKTQLVVIADNLDRITSTIQEDNRTNYDHIFIDRSEQLKALDCDIIYTVPISMLYSNRAADLKDIYGDDHILPMIMIRNPDLSIYNPGLKKVKEVIARRVHQVNPNYILEKDICENLESLNRLCLMSGGHVRELMHLIRGALKRVDSLPLSTKAIQRSITEVRDIYHRTVEQHQWKTLAEAAYSKTLKNDNEYKDLLFNRCLLEYCYFDEQGNKKRWCDVHPLIKDIPEFQEELEEVSKK